MQYQKRSRPNAKHTRPHIDYSGKKFGPYSVIKEVGRSDQRCVVWSCLCDCGKERNISTSQFLHTNLSHCICDRPPIVVIEAINEGRVQQTTHPLYVVYTGIKGRCYCLSDAAYHLYGGRGISICQEWRTDFKSFFDWAMSNGWQKGLHVDRIDNDGNYGPLNCRIVTPRENAMNKRNTVRIMFRGELRTLLDLEKMGCGVSAGIIRSRIGNGWSIELAIGTPIQKPTTKNYTRLIH